MGVQGPAGPTGATGPAGSGDGFDVYDNSGGQTFTSSAITLNLDTVRTDTSGSVFDLSSDVVTVDTSGTFVLIFRASIESAGGQSRATVRAILERNTGSGWSEVDGFRAYTYVRSTSNPENTLNAQGILEINAGDQFRVRVARVSGSLTARTLADGSGLTLFEL